MNKGWEGNVMIFNLTHSENNEWATLEFAKVTISGF